MVDVKFFKDKRVLITGHTGFKGSWLCEILNNFGAKVYGYALHPSTTPNLYELANLDKKIISKIGDIRDYESLLNFFNKVKPEIVIHLAAQPIVRESYKKPKETYDINVIGTVNVVEAIRNCDSVKSFLNVTTDKVYKNLDYDRMYVESDILNGIDPYSNSKSCSELITECYKKSFFNERNIGISTARAGNVLGGGDFSRDRLIPDCFKHTLKNESIIIRNPNSIRPFQHVLDALFAYLLIVEKQYLNNDLADNYNIGPEEEDCISSSEIANLFCKYWGDKASWKAQNDDGPYEAKYLKLDSSKIKKQLGWKQVWHIDRTIKETVNLYKLCSTNENIEKFMDEQIELFRKENENV